MEETVLTQAISKLNGYIQTNNIIIGNSTIAGRDVEFAKRLNDYLEVFKDELISLLPKDREQIEKAHYMGLIITGERAKWPLEKKKHYFENNFTQYKPNNMGSNEILDEKGFVFIASNGKPYWCRMISGSPWLCYWHPDDRWVTLRKITQAEIWVANEMRLPDEQAQLYHNLNCRK